MQSQGSVTDNRVEILIVEDSPTQALKLKYVLERHGYQVSVARSGQEALASLKQHKPLMVISGIIMPEMDGYELCRQIKGDAGLQEIPVVLLTWLADRGDLVKSLECGADNFIVKPYSEESLLARMHAILTNHELRRHAGTARGSEIIVAGEKHVLTSERTVLRMIDLLLAAYETAVERNVELREARERLELLTEERQQTGEAERVESKGARQLHILLAEDSTVNQRLAVHVLEKQGHTVVVANNGREALEALAREGAAPGGRPFDLVLMDVEMPEMGGFEATAAIRATEHVGQAVSLPSRADRQADSLPHIDRQANSLPHIPIIAMTAHTGKGDRERCLEAGMDRYVSKPIRPAELLAAIEELTPSLAPPLPGVGQEEGPPAGAAAVEVFDQAELLSRVEGDMELLGVVAGLFLKSYPQQLSELRAAIAQRDSHAVERLAHALKGAVGNFAAHSAFAAALRLETLGCAGELAEAEGALADLEAQIERLRAALAALGRAEGPAAASLS